MNFFKKFKPNQSPLLPVHSHPLEPSFKFSTDLQNHLTGRALLAEEIPFPKEILKEHYNNGHLGKMNGVVQDGSQYLCRRCGNRTPRMFYTFPCSRCNENCTYCRSCIMMGRVSTCSKLYTWTGPERKTQLQPTFLQWSGSLSEGQATASGRVAKAVMEQEELLVWAVCGAGKTEVLFKGIDLALQVGHRVCIATPRTDVVLELAPRMKKAFPTIEVAALYGGSEDRHVFAPLTVSTTHQLFRFYQAFDTIVIDEVDAFPYSIDSGLKYAVSKSKKPTSATIYLTATPSAKMKKSTKAEKLRFVTIPARYHRHSIPVPILKWCGNWEKQLQSKHIPAPVASWVTTRLQNNIPFLLFFPSIKTMEHALPLFQMLHADIQAVHSQDPERKAKVSSIREDKLPGLLTTTILERGVTIARLEVAVIGAEHDIFSESALVQIAGRAGRSAEHPSGNVTFFHYGKTNEMVKAIRHIREMNAEARKRGLIDD